MIRAEVKRSPWNKRPEDEIEEQRGNDPEMVVTPLGPGIGEKKVEGADGLSLQEGEYAEGVPIQEADIADSGGGGLPVDFFQPEQ